MRKLFFLWAIPLTVAAQSWLVLDYHLAPRFMFLAFGTLLFGGLLLFQKSRTKEINAGKGAKNLPPAPAEYEATEWHFLDLLLLLYFLWNVVSISYAHLKSEAIFETLKMLLVLCAYRLTRITLKRDGPAAENMLLLANGLATGLVLLVTFSQWLTLSNGDPIGFILDPEKTYQLTALSAHRNLNAGYLLMLLPFNMLACLRTKGGLRTVAIILVVVQVLVMWLLDSDAVVLGMAFGLMVAQLLWFSGHVKSGFKWNALPTIGMAILLLGIVGAIGMGAFGKMAHKLRESDTGRERLFLWVRSYNVIKDHNLLGVGNGNWQILFPSKSIAGSYRLQDQEVYATRPHNDFIWIWAELGIIGLVLWLIVLLSVFVAGFATALRQTLPRLRWETWLPLCGLASWMVFSFFDFPRERIEHQALLAVWLGWLGYMAAPFFEKIIKINISPKVMNILGGVLLCFSLYVGYQRCMGEHHMRVAIFAKTAGNWQLVKESAKLAKSNLYEIDPTTFPIAWYEGMGNYFTGNKTNSYQYFEEAYSVHPYNAHVVNNYGTSLLEQKRDQDARNLYEAAVSINPQFEDGKRNLVVACANLKDFEAAHKWLKLIEGDSATIQRYTNFLLGKEKGK